MKKEKILIVGAGIAGLALARTLRQQNIPFDLIEKQPGPETSGSGIALPFNAMQSLRRMGLFDQVMESAHQVHDIIYTKANGRTLAQASLQQPSLADAPFVALMRDRLHEILRQGLESDVRFATTVTGMTFKEHKEPPNHVEFSNSALNANYDLVVAADGVHSQLREKAFPDESTTVDYGMKTWRFVVTVPDHGLQPIYMLGKTDLFMAYPLGKDRLYCYAHVYAGSGSEPSGGDDLEQLSQLLGHYGGPVPAILAQLHQTEPTQRHIIPGRLTSVRKPYFGHQRTVFIGDAASACSPLLQQGAAAAFEDVLCLAQHLQQAPLDQAIKQYQVDRQQRVEWIVNYSDAPLAKIQMMQSPLGQFIRNSMIRVVGPLNVFGWKKLASGNL